VIAIAETYIDKASGEEVELPKEPINLSYVKQLAGMGKTHKEIAERCGTTKAYIDKILYEDRKKKAAEAKTAAEVLNLNTNNSDSN
jgi:cyanate lyase